MQLSPHHEYNRASLSGVKTLLVYFSVKLILSAS